MSTLPKVGERLPDVRLGSMGGHSVALSDHAGRKKLVFLWASWCGCREKLGLVEAFHRKHAGLPVISIACDAQGVLHPMRYLSRVKATHELWIDATCVVARRWRIKRVGVTLLLDENDVVLLAGEHPDEKLLAEAEALLAKAPSAPPPVPAADTKGTKVDFLVQQCTNYLTRNRTEDAVGFLKQALALDPANQVIPKQVWAILHPERFYDGPIDKEWQRQQPPVTP
jgi:hypothetical protein